MNDAPKTPGQSFATTSCGKSGRKFLQVIKHRPEQPFSQRGVATLIGVGKIIATRRGVAPRKAKSGPLCNRSASQTSFRPGVSQLRKEHTHYVTPRTEGSCHGIHAVSRASFGTRCGGISLQSCRRTVSFDAVGLLFLLITFVE